jgi:hypothetical protein
MIEGAKITAESDVLIELLPNEMFRAKVRWVDGEHAGLQFARPFNVERLNAPAPSRVLRRSA